MPVSIKGEFQAVHYSNHVAYHLIETN